MIDEIITQIHQNNNEVTLVLMTINLLYIMTMNLLYIIGDFSRCSIYVHLFFVLVNSFTMYYSVLNIMKDF